MKNVLFCFAILCLTGLDAFSQPDSTSTGFFDEAAAPAKMLAAKHEYNENNLRGALLIYREVLQVDPENANALYWTAKCHYRLKKYDLAEEYLDKAIQIDDKVQKDVNFFYGQINHRLAKLDKAIEYYEKYLPTVGKNTFDYEDCASYINQCHFAKEMMASPVNVNIENMGRPINSRFDEYAPSITADGKLLIFTSRRSDTEGGEIDEGGDYKFFEDVYYAEWQEDQGEWTNSAGVDGEVNTKTHDAVLSISPNGTQMFVYKNNAQSTGDIFRSTYDRAGQQWRIPERLPRPVNTSYFEGSVSITADGKKLFFVSERPGGQGQLDIYMSESKSEGTWGSPKNLGDVINTELDEKFVFIHPNGKTLYFSSNGHQTMGSYDLFKSEFVNGQWSLPVNLGYPINTVNEESTFSLTRDNKTLIIAAEYEDSFGERDIYAVDVSQYKLIATGYDQSAYGTVICMVTDDNGRQVKGADVQFFGASSQKLITEEKTDKSGRVKINLPGNRTYKMVVKNKKGQHEEEFELKLKKEKETVVKFEVQL